MVRRGTMPTTVKRKLVRGGARRVSVDSEDESEVQVTSPVSPCASTTDGEESDEPFSKRAATASELSGRGKSVPMQFLECFLTNFSPEELAAKRTVETIYSGSGPCPPGVPLSTLRNYELLLVGAVRKLGSALSVDANAVGWRKVMCSLRCLVVEGLGRELRALLSSLCSDGGTANEAFLPGLERLQVMIRTLGSVYESQGEKRERGSEMKERCNIAECLDVLEQIKGLLTYLRSVHRLVATTIANRPESEGLECLLRRAECVLGIGEESGGEECVSKGGICIGEECGFCYGRVECVKLLLSEESCKCLCEGEVVSESNFVRQKFESICSAFEEQRRRQREEQAEVARKSKLKRDAISYVLARVSECESPSAPGNIRHPFYILGIRPSRCNEGLLRKWGRKLKTLLHPDTEHDPEWKALAERAFKEASLALEKCATFNGAARSYVGLRIVDNPPFAAFIGLSPSSEGEAEASASSSSSSCSSSSCDNIVTAPSVVIIPSFVVSCMESKAGALNVLLDPSVFSQPRFTKLGKNKQVVVYVHRPVHCDEPSAFCVSRVSVSDVRRVPLPDSTQSKQLSIKVDAVQPIMFGSAWRYFVGVQLVGDQGASLVAWRSIYVELASKGRTASHVCKLLGTFLGASFVNQSVLQSHMSRCREGVKTEAESFWESAPSLHSGGRTASSSK
ncbi:DnaJ domain containing protein, putative [Babesia caballi]|uniref:DnaJ domain containing protein, putative n=1 Tax=Babesia caballi TaxID=5871 RepID=A0AAV4M2Z5_BABCB|nr:DnaJ domain containing protein, putative [Babesia caballi]